MKIFRVRWSSIRKAIKLQRDFETLKEAEKFIEILRDEGNWSAHIETWDGVVGA